MAPSLEALNGSASAVPNGAHANGHVKPVTIGFEPLLSERLYVQRSDQAFCSGAISLVDLPAGAVFAKITTATPTNKAYTSVQTSETSHIELNSDLVFCNHSCNPSLEFDMYHMEVRVVRGRDLRKGEPLTFFYPSSEWDMAQPFTCACGAGKGKCCGTIAGAKDMDARVLGRYWLNRHIVRMLEARKVAEKGVSGSSVLSNEAVPLVSVGVKG
jgi:hypothetical protein